MRGPSIQWCAATGIRQIMYIHWRDALLYSGMHLLWQACAQSTTHNLHQHRCRENHTQYYSLSAEQLCFDLHACCNEAWGWHRHHQPLIQWSHVKKELMPLLTTSISVSSVGCQSDDKRRGGICQMHCTSSQTHISHAVEGWPWLTRHPSSHRNTFLSLEHFVTID